MAVLTRDEILKELDAGNLSINPLDKDSIGPASIDFHLDNTFRVFRQVKDLVHISEDIDYESATKLIRIDDYLTLFPGQSVHGITTESITLPDNLCGWIQGRSKLARIGLAVHTTANFIHPGMIGKQVLEMTNIGPMPLAIHPGIAICQIILEETKGRATYTGIFKNQQKP